MKSVLPIIVLVPILLRAAEPAEPAEPRVVRQEIVVTASAVPEAVSQTPAAVTVLDASDIETSGARDLGELLRRVPGLTLSLSGSPGKVASLFTRGGSSKHTLVLWNGVEVNNPFFSGYDFGHVSTAGIERVEVVRGPFSALYGSDAVSGVINVLTESTRGFASADVQAGERGLRNGRIGGSGGGEAWRASGSVEVRRDEGFAQNDDLEQTSATGEIRMIGASAWSAGARARWVDYETGIPRVVDASGSTFVPSLERRESADELELAVPLHVAHGRTEWEVLLSRADRDEAFEDPLDPFARTWARTDVTTDRAALTARVAVARQTLVAGAEWESAAVADASSYGTNLESRRRTGRGIFVEDRASFDPGPGEIELSAGARYDRYDTFGGQLSPRAAAAWVVGRQKVRAGWGGAFRAPAIGELYFPFFGNENLEPERSTSWEVGWDGGFGAARLSATIFATEFDQLIVYDNVANRFENVGAGWARGVELGAEGSIGRALRVSGSWTWLRTEEAETGSEFLRRPGQSGSISARWESGPWAAGAAAVYVGEREDLTDLFPWGRVTNDAYATVDLVIERRVGEVVSYAKLENATDERYEEVFGYPSPGRRAVIGVRVTME
ncbi:MAG TPA: TonB-dependent receptor [Thermoanaerobaculia bacterium]